MPPIVTVRQQSFASGELAPELYGRTDLEQYATGLRECLNFYISKHGALVSRPGTTDLGAASSNSTASRLIPFYFEGGSAYVLEFGHNTIRVWYQGALIAIDGAATSIVTNWSTAECAELKFSQVGDVLTIVHSSDDPYTLTRASHNDWNLAVYSVELPQFLAPLPSILEALPVADATHPEKEWRWKFTSIEQQADGKITESAPVEVDYSTNGDPAGTRTETILPDRLIALYPDAATFFVTLDWSGGVFIGTSAFLGFRIYRGRGRLLGLIHQTDAEGDDIAGTLSRWVDDAADADYTQQPPQGTNPWDVRNAAGGIERTERPTCVAYFEQRQVFGGASVDATSYRPGLLVFSKTDDLTNFDRKSSPIFNVASDPIEITLAATKREQIRALLPIQNRLLVFTDQSVWTVGGSAGALSATDLPEVRRQLDVGITENLDPIVVDGDILFVRSKANGVSAIAYSNDRGAFEERDLSYAAQHLFDGRTITSWCLQKDLGILWLVMSDGLILSGTYNKGSGTIGWCRHNFDVLGHRYAESVCCIPESGVDKVYFATYDNASPNFRRIERLASRLVAEDGSGDPDPTTYVGLSGAKTYSSPGSTTLTGLTHLAAQSVYALVDGLLQGPLTVTAGGEVTVTGSAPTSACVGKLYISIAQLLDTATAKGRVKNVKVVDLDVIASKGLFTGQTSALATAALSQDVDLLAAYTGTTLFTGTVQARIESSWKTSGRVFVGSTYPLPTTILAVQRSGEIGGDG